MPFLQFQGECPTSREMIPLPCRSGVRAGTWHGGDPAPECRRGCWNRSFIISFRFSDHLRKGFSGTVPTGAAGTPGKGINSLMREVISKVQGFFFLFVHLFSIQNSKDRNWKKLSCISLTLNLRSRQKHIGTSTCGLLVPNARPISLLFLFSQKILHEKSCLKQLTFQEEQKYYLSGSSEKINVFTLVLSEESFFLPPFPTVFSLLLITWIKWVTKPSWCITEATFLHVLHATYCLCPCLQWPLPQTHQIL